MNALLNRPAIAILLALAGFAAFSFGDAFARHLIRDNGYNVFFVASMCQWIGLALLAMFHQRLGGWPATLQSKNKKWHMVRGLVISILVPANIYSFSVLPFALTYTLLFTGAFWLLLFSAFITHEKIPLQKSLAVFVGMIGALIVLRPWADGFDWRMLIPIGSAMMYAVNSLVARRMGDTETRLSLPFYGVIICGSLMLVLAILTDGMRLPATNDLPFFLATGIMTAIGMLCVPLAFRYANASVVAPFHYTQLIWGAIIGAVFFHELPSFYTIAGGLCIVAGGVIALLAARQESA